MLPLRSRGGDKNTTCINCSTRTAPRKIGFCSTDVSFRMDGNDCHDLHFLNNSKVDLFFKFLRIRTTANAIYAALVIFIVTSALQA